MDILNLGLAFLEGMALIASPCVLPILPIVLSAGLDSGKWRPYGLITGFIFSFWTFTLLSRKLVSVLGVDPGLIRNISFAVLFIFGLVLCSEFLSEKFTALSERLVRMGQSLSSQLSARESESKRSGFFSGFLLGIFIGLIWSPCVGPIIAIVLVQVIRQETDLASALLLAAFSIGVSVPMLLITLGGKKVMAKLDFFKRKGALVRKILGIIILVTVLLTAGSEWFNLTPPSFAASPNIKILDGLANPSPAPEFKGISAWINSKPLTMAQLKGKVVLVDFWTYSCVNCIRTLPHITAWDKKYRGKGLVIVGVHSPEFEFEKKLSNVQMAVKKYGIQYPVALDNNLDTFTGFENRYWPAHYLIDKNGRIVYTHFGEGKYDVTESNIRAFLGIAGAAAPDTNARGFGAYDQTPETYLGYARAEHFDSPEGLQKNTTATYTFPKTSPMHAWSLSGKWAVGAEKISSREKGASLRLRFTAKKVFLVLGSDRGQPVQVSLWLNGKLLKNNAGKDISHNRLSVKEHRLYELVNQETSKPGWLEIRSHEPGLSAYAFTFGS
ncbi:MAG: cytochrome c biogenesis protein DipZ [Vampirovibrionales bacterium]|nr:cytochrome c biogenesis protein DipZ [Vampirovibrionales bacterium]